VKTGECEVFRYGFAGAVGLKSTGGDKSAAKTTNININVVIIA
jgi:hypothetical protein